MHTQTQHQIELLPNTGHVEGFVTLSLDRMGIIRHCDRSTAMFFNGHPSQLLGKSISSLIPDIPFSNHAPGYTARRIAHLSSSPDWQEFRGLDLKGRSLPLKLKLNRIANTSNSNCVYAIEFLYQGGENTAGKSPQVGILPSY